jgi:hypothetical protein
MVERVSAFNLPPRSSIPSLLYRRWSYREVVYLMESSISLLLNHLAELHNSLTLASTHLDNAWKRYHEIMIEIGRLR